jgi:hypothetical protein
MALYLNTNIFSVTENTSTEAVFVIKVNRLWSRSFDSLTSLHSQ